MGYIAHNAIIVSTFDRDMIELARSEATRIGLLVTDAHTHKINGDFTFLVIPDGSKEGWPESDEGDRMRAMFWDWMAAQVYEDGSNVLDAVEIRYGGDFKYDSPATVIHELTPTPETPDHDQ
jgi:hypothetical protein